MSKTRGQWIRFLLAGLSVAAAPLGFPSARAQGFGPDPFRPYNSQYDAYLRPLSDPGLSIGGAASALGRNDNQYQQYLNQLEGADRASIERYGIGVPHWRARSDPERDRRDAKARNRAQRAPEATLESINQKYLAYFSEDDPRKRAILLREFSSTHRGGTRATSERGIDDSDDRDAAADLDPIRRPRARAGERSDDRPLGRTTRGRSDEEGRSGTSMLSRRSSRANAEADEGSIPPPPPVRGLSRGTSKKARTPSDVLKRSRDDDDADSLIPPAIRRRREAKPAPSSPDE